MVPKLYITKNKLWPTCPWVIIADYGSFKEIIECYLICYQDAKEALKLYMDPANIPEPSPEYQEGGRDWNDYWMIPDARYQ